MALVLPAARVLDGWPPTTAWASRAARAARLRRLAVPVAGLVMLVLPVAAGSAEESRTPTYAGALTTIDRVIPPGSCVANDQVSLLISADRITSSAPGCPFVVDGTGTSYDTSKARP